MKLVAKSSPNRNSRNNKTVDTIVLHADASDSEAATLSWLQSPESKVSYHVLIGRDGTVYQIVPVALRAWHAGVSGFGGHTDVNTYSIGISFGNKNDGKEKYTDQQYAVGAALVASLMKQFPKVTLDRGTTHAIIAPTRKNDPLGFDMARFKMLVQAELMKSA